MSVPNRSSTNGRQPNQSVSKPTTHHSLFVKVKYNNTLPDIPFDPKFIVNPLNISRFVEYQTTSLEQNSKHELLTPMNLGVDIDLILPERYAIPANPIHDPEDEKLINDDEPILPSSSAKKSVRDKPHSQLHNKVVPWLKKTEYISTEYNRYGASNEKTETKVGYTLRKNMKDEQIFLDKDSQIRAINETFEAAQKPIDKHPTKPDVYAERVMPLLPDFETWKYFYAHVKFDSEPTDSSKADQMSQAIIRGAYDEELRESFVVYFLPTEVTMADRIIDQNNGLEFSEGKEYEYKSNREYTWLAKQDPKGDDFFFVIRDDTVFYNRLSMEVTLKKRRNKSQNATISTLVVRNRELNDEELTGQNEKLAILQKPKAPELPDLDMTAQSLENAYEEQFNDRTNDSAGNNANINVNDRMSDNGDDNDSSSQENSSSSSASSPAQSSSVSSTSSSSEEESESEDDDDDDDDDDNPKSKR